MTAKQRSTKGTFVISIDVEMAWGTFDVGGLKKHERDFEKVREVITRLLEVFQHYQTPVTWAIVGHLFLDSCRPENGIAHPDMPRPSYPWFPADWYSLDPCTNYKKDPIWYGKDIVELIRSNNVNHEIACHSFSHVDFGHKGCSEEIARKEIQKCVQLADNIGLQMKSFVFPKNKTGHLDILKENGFNVYRGKDKWWSDRFKRPLLNNIAQFAEEFFCLPPRCHLPAEVLPGLWELPGSMLFRSLNGPMALIPLSWRPRRALMGLHRAVAKREVFQLWFHPWHIANGLDKLINSLSIILKEASRLRELGMLEVVTLSEMPELYGNK